MPRAVLIVLYAVLVAIWSSTWVTIKFGLEDTPPLLGAGVRFTLAGLVLLAVTRARRRPLRTDLVLVTVLAAFPFAATYGLVYWSEQYIPSGLTAVLFGAMPIYVAIIAWFALADEKVGPRLFAGIGLAFAGLAVAFGESLNLGVGEKALLGSLAAVVAPLASAIGNVAIRRRGSPLDPVTLNGWAMLAGGAVLLAISAPFETWGDAVWSGKAVAAITYLALVGSAFPFVVLTILLRELGAITVSYIPLLIPFGALALGAWLYDEPLTTAAIVGAALVAAGLVVAQRSRGTPPAPEAASSDPVVR